MSCGLSLAAVGMIASFPLMSLPGVMLVITGSALAWFGRNRPLSPAAVAPP